MPVTPFISKIAQYSAARAKKIEYERVEHEMRQKKEENNISPGLDLFQDLFKASIHFALNLCMGFYFKRCFNCCEN